MDIAPTGKAGKDLKRLRGTVLILGICVLLQTVSIVHLIWKIARIMDVLNLITESLYLLAAK